LHCIVSNLKNYKQNVDVSPLEKFLRMTTEKGLWVILMKVFLSLLYAILRNFSKLRLTKAFHRSTMTDERLMNMAMISTESDTAKSVRYD